MPSDAPRHTLARHWELLRLLPPLGSGRSALELTNALVSKGFKVSKRQVERDLRSLSESFPIESIHKNPQGWRFLHGDRIEATYSREARPILLRINLLLEKLRHLFRLARELHYLDPRRYKFAARATDEIGRMVRGVDQGGPASGTGRGSLGKMR